MLLMQLETKAVTAGVLNALGDVLAQLTVDRDKPFDWKRLGIFTFLGVALIGPALHAWYGVLGKLVTATGSKGQLGLVLGSSVACSDQVF